jgi:hypothetical protein
MFSAERTERLGGEAFRKEPLQILFFNFVVTFFAAVFNNDSPRIVANHLLAWFI